MRAYGPIWLGCVLFATTPLWSQADNPGAQAEGTGPTTTTADQMVAPPPVSGGAYETAYTSEARANYLLGGLAFGTAYSDNALGGIRGYPVGEASYSVWPMLTLDVSMPRVQSLLLYSSGFTFYQRTNALNEADQNLSLDVQYRLSPHVSIKVLDSFRKASSIFSQPDFLGTNPVSGSAQPSTATIIPPVADQLINTGNVQLTYQFRANAMIGVSGTITDLHYPDPAKVPGLYDSTSRGGTAFYSHRLAGKHYIGLTYQYQVLRAFPTGFQAETQTHTALFFYTVYPRRTLSLSLFGGPQYANTQESIEPALRTWAPAAGASLGWQGQRTSLAVSYSRMIAAGGGLIGATHQNAANMAARRQLTRMLSFGVSGSYANNAVLAPVASFSAGGHMISGTASIQRPLGAHINCGIGYTRLHQSYNNIPAISGVPDTNREWISIAYQFARPVGR